MRSWWLRAVGGLALAWALMSAVAAWRAVAVPGPDRVTMLEAEFRTLSALVPSSSVVGYLEHYEQADSTDNILEYYVAQYAFAPRLVVRRTDLEFLIVPRGAARPGEDERLVGFEPLAGSAGGHRLYHGRARQ